MATVGVRELKNRLTQFLRRARQGEEVVVTERGRPIAVIRPIGPGETASGLDARLARLAAQGFLTLPARAPLARVRLARAAGEPLSKTILRDRG
ncbi:MAG TPA: type II toxin-antitoxin system prevent-host-death family antitoxin [bacterium]|nr:type II toxin-antitoxin system prevent-host-death family antitoxin [bacterium]